MNNDILQRIETELGELIEKTNKLYRFTYTTEFSKLSYANRILLEEQLEAMEKYKQILQVRLELNKK